jgi:GTP-binding protein
MAEETMNSHDGEPQFPVVVIVGRPNVGKSTWFNRVIGEQAAIVEDRPGVTRDRNTRIAQWLGHRFYLVDTGGWLPKGDELEDKVSKQVEEAVKTADLVIFMVDASVGPTDDDELIAGWLRRAGVPVLLAANKSDVRWNVGSSCRSVWESHIQYPHFMVDVPATFLTKSLRDYLNTQMTMK